MPFPLRGPVDGVAILVLLAALGSCSRADVESTLNTESQMTAFIIVETTVLDPEKLSRYRAQVGSTLSPFGGSVALAGGDPVPLEGSARHQAALVLSFPDPASAEAWYASEAYQALIPLRDEAMRSEFVLYRGR